MTAFYNEIDPYAAQCLRNLIAAGHIAPGIVDERPIQDIEPYELVGFTQCHFFAGIGIWSLALRQAGWSDNDEIWTGSCPCQPFSTAGQQKGFDDDRHLWPTFHKLIDERRPARVLGEQVASKDGLQWLDLVSADLEASGYAFGAADLCAAGFGQAHLRQRLYFVGLANNNNNNTGLEGRSFVERGRGSDQCLAGPGSVAGRMADASPELDNWSGNAGPGRRLEYPNSGDTGGLANPLPTGRPERGASAGIGPIAGSGSDGGGEHADSSSQHGGAPSRGQSLCDFGDGANQEPAIRDPGQIAERWLDVDWLLCRNPAGEPSWRPVGSGFFPLAHGIANRMGKLRAYGNALDLETATGFAQTIKEICEGLGSVMDYDL